MRGKIVVRYLRGHDRYGRSIDRMAARSTPTTQPQIPFAVPRPLVEDWHTVQPRGKQ
jgi:hypothetical protein